MHLFNKSTAMKEQTYFHIPEPCHENWDNMTPQDKGRFCASCSKQVVDFSLMSDQQVLNYFKNATGKTCGRFANDQLQRPMIETPKQKKKAWWVAAMIPLLLLFDKANAQKKNISKGKVCKTISNKQTGVLGMVLPEINKDTVQSFQINESNRNVSIEDTAITVLPKYITVKGKITDAKSNTPLAGASIFIKGTNLGIAADVNGDFTLSIKQSQYLPTIIISFIGFQTKEIDLNKDESEIISRINKTENSEEITLRPEMTILQQALSGEVIVVSRRLKHADTAKTIVKKILQKEAFKIFPNPVEKGSEIKIEIRKASNYSVQLLDNNAKLILVKSFQVKTENSVINISIPSFINVGIYYLTLIDENKKKQYTDKLIVQ